MSTLLLFLELAVITASAALQAAGGLDYMVDVAARFLRKHPSRITFYGPLVTWLFALLAGTAHTCYALLPIISEIEPLLPAPRLYHHLRFHRPWAPSWALCSAPASSSFAAP